MSKLEFFDDVIHRNCDCMDLLSAVPDNTVKLTISSPPYNIGKEYESKKNIDDYLAEQVKVIKELHRVCSEDGSICWQVGNYVQDGSIIPLDWLFYPIFLKLGMKLRNRIIWRFGHGLHAKKRLSGRYEVLLWFTKTDKYVFDLDTIRIPCKYPGKLHYKGDKKGQPSCNPLGKNPSDVWEIVEKEWNDGVWDIPNVKQNHCEKTIHPCQFPVELAERCVLAMTKEGDWVCDPYSGVGSTIIAAIKNGRKGIGSEIDALYYKVSEERIEKMRNNELKTRHLGTPVFTPVGKVSLPVEK